MVTVPITVMYTSTFLPIDPGDECKSSPNERNNPMAFRRGVVVPESIGLITVFIQNLFLCDDVDGGK